MSSDVLRQAFLAWDVISLPVRQEVGEKDDRATVEAKPETSVIKL
jgi:hypothetical protein